MRKWRTRDGRLLDISQMTCEHLRNALNYILRNRFRMHWLSILLAEIDRRCKPPRRDPETTVQKDKEVTM